MVRKAETVKLPIPVIAEFYAGAVIALSTWWLENDMPFPEEEMVKYVDLMINNKDEVSEDRQV